MEDDDGWMMMGDDMNDDVNDDVHNNFHNDVHSDDGRMMNYG